MRKQRILNSMRLSNILNMLDELSNSKMPGGDMMLLADCKVCEKKIQCALGTWDPIKVPFKRGEEDMQTACFTCWTYHQVYTDMNQKTSWMVL